MSGHLPMLSFVLSCTGCLRCDLDAADFAPVTGDWAISTPAEQGLDPEAVHSLFCAAERRETLYGVVVAKNGHLVAERYYPPGAVDEVGNRQSVTKSFTSALVGVALEQGCLDSVDQRLLDFYPEHVDSLNDERKRDITLEHMLQMRAGFGWEEEHPDLWDLLWSGQYAEHLDDVPLVADPGTEHHYSNLTSIWLAIATARACETDLRSFAQEHLLHPIGAAIGPWAQDVDGYYIGSGEIDITARDMARFGQLYLDDGMVDGARVLPEGWVQASFTSYSSELGASPPGPQLEDYGYGYQWWSAQAGAHHVDFAWGHGGSFIFVVDALDLVVAVTADPFYGQHDATSWANEKAHLNMVGAFISSLE